MIGRPRCREWTPLATQQLRLRSLIQIVGYNIRPPEGCRSPCSFYITLHHTSMSAPFYTSEKITSPHPKWKEIDSEITHHMSSNNVVIRIWCHIPNEIEDETYQDKIIQTWGVYFSGLRYIGANLALNFTSDCFKSNTLVFQMHGGYFCSYRSLKLDIIPAENEIEHGSLSSDSSGKTFSKTIEAKFIQHQKAARSISPNKFTRKIEKEYSKSHSPVDRTFKNYSALKTSTSLNIGQKERGDVINDVLNVEPNFIYEYSPESLDVSSSEASVSKRASKALSNSKIDLSETAENYDLRNETDAPKYRYLALSFLKSEIRHSYNAKKLQQLHILQYEIKKRQEQVQEIKERIYHRSALTDSPLQDYEDKLKCKSKYQKNLFSPEESSEMDKLRSAGDVRNGRVKEERPVTSNGPRLMLKLNDLLSFKSKPSPSQRAEALRLTKQIEVLRFKRRILADERDRKLGNLRRLKEVRAKLVEQNQDLGLELLSGYHSLSRQSEALGGARASCGALRELAARSHQALHALVAARLTQLHHIFCIRQQDSTTWSICGVPLPVCGDGPAGAGAGVGGARGGSLRDAAAAGLAAQALVVAAALAQQPLRYKITLLGSASKILDVTPDLPDPNIPLFARNGDVALFRYGLFLLNKCIAQVMWARGLPVSDIRPTLANLARLLTAHPASSNTCKLFGSHSWAGAGGGAGGGGASTVPAQPRGHRAREAQPTVQQECVDGPAECRSLRRHRHSKSVGSYNDQELPTLNQSTTSIMGSEPNIYNTKLEENDVTPATMKTHNSDSEISRFTLEKNDSSDNRVVFTLGEEDLNNAETEKLVRISTNNGDEVSCQSCLDENVKRICSEISDFCSKDSEFCSKDSELCSKDSNICSKVHEGFDIASHLSSEHIDIMKHLERKASEIEDAGVCASCKTDKDGKCGFDCAKNIQDVIVIPSAEAILDTGQIVEEKSKRVAEACQEETERKLNIEELRTDNTEELRTDNTEELRRDNTEELRRDNTEELRTDNTEELRTDNSEGRIVNIKQDSLGEVAIENGRECSSEE